MSEESPRPRDQRDVVRLVAAIVVIAAFIALAALAIAASRSSFSIATSAGALAPEVGRPLPEVPVLDALVAAPAPSAPVALAVAPLAPAPTPVLAPVEPPPLPEIEGKPCAALSLPAPSEVGGLQSLIRLVPLFGPFSPEAFAMMPAFQPGFEALGPLFPLFESGLDQAAPLLDAVTPVAQQLGEAGFGALAPLYGPYREDVLAGEAQLAAYLQPIVQSLASAPGSECLVALEGVLADIAP